jgi:ABC-type polar amino acid transport system ATPase subunit
VIRGPIHTHAQNGAHLEIERGEYVSIAGELVMSLRRDHRDGATICLVTHDPRSVRNADRTVHPFDGRIVEEERRVGQEQEPGESRFEIGQERWQ